MASSHILGNANGKFVTLTNPDTNNSDVVVDVSKIASTVSPALTGVPTAPTASIGDNSTKVATTAYVKTEIPNALNASGTAPIYACRAWVNFNGTATVAIRASGNVSSITDNGVGFYKVNYLTAQSDINYCAISTGGTGNTAFTSGSGMQIGEITTTHTFISSYLTGNGAALDVGNINFAVFR